jgi:hypothetical protein
MLFFPYPQLITSPQDFVVVNFSTDPFSFGILSGISETGLLPSKCVIFPQFLPMMRKQ